MWHLGTWFGGRLGSVRFVFGLDDLQAFSNLNVSMIL